jgi:hypothetical protein
MNPKFKHIAILNLAIAFFLFSSCFSQNWGGTESNGLWTNWSVNINAGMTSYFGDISLYDLNIGDKLLKESGPAFGLILTKNIFIEAIGISGQLISGNLEGRKDNLSFKTKLIEYNLHLRIDFVDLCMPDRNHNLGISGYVGAGQFLFTTIKKVNDDGLLKNYKRSTGVPEFVCFFGAGIYYKVNEKLGIVADLALRQCHNDRLDDYVKNNDYDYYSYLSIGVSYYIKSFKTAPLKNKARLANSSSRLQH